MTIRAQTHPSPRARRSREQDRASRSGTSTRAPHDDGATAGLPTPPHGHPAQAGLPTPPHGHPETAGIPTPPHGEPAAAPATLSPPLDHRTVSRSIPAGGAPPGRYLSFEVGDELRLIPLERPITHIGRGLIADVRIEDTHVSRRQAIIAVRAGRARVLDDRSTNGTFRNGGRIEASDLADGDVLRFGTTVLRYVEIARPVRERPLVRIKRSRRPKGLLATPAVSPYTAPVSR